MEGASVIFHGRGCSIQCSRRKRGQHHQVGLLFSSLIAFSLLTIFVAKSWLKMYPTILRLRLVVRWQPLCLLLIQLQGWTNLAMFRTPFWLQRLSRRWPSKYLISAIVLSIHGRLIVCSSNCNACATSQHISTVLHTRNTFLPMSPSTIPHLRSIHLLVMH